MLTRFVVVDSAVAAVSHGNARTKNILIAQVSLLFIIATLPMTSGCQTPTHAEAKNQAEQRWSKVRGEVKLQLARQQFERGLFEDAIKTLKEAMALNPTSPEANALLAKANLELNKPTTAEQVLAAAAKLGIESAELHYLHGVVLEQRNELKSAYAEYSAACKLDSTKSMYMLAQIETLVALNRAEEALALTDASMNQFDDEASLAILGARIAIMMGDTQGALQRFQNPAIQGAGSRIATEELGVLLAVNGHCLEAIQTLQPLADVTDGPEISAQARRSLAGCYLDNREPRSAISLLSSHTAAHPEDTASQLLLAKAALSAGEYITALQTIESARRGKTHIHDFDLLLATTHWKRGDFAGAREVLEDILKSDPTDVDAWCLLGEVLSGLDKQEEAREAFKRALGLDPECRWAAVQLGGTDVRISPQKPAEKKITKKS